ncbi:MAG: tetratricopeptide repeat protein [Thermodesulfobacteriota bacterium]
MSNGLQPSKRVLGAGIPWGILFSTLIAFLGCTLSISSPEKWFQQGVEAVSNRRYEDAVTFFKKALEQDPSFSAAHYRLGEVYSRMGERQAAISELTQALIHSPHLVEARKLLATLYYQSKQYDQAIAILQNLDRSLHLDPDIASIHASCLIETGALQQANAILRESLDIHRNHIGLNLTFARLQALHRNATQLQTILDYLIGQYPEDISIRLAGFSLLEKCGRFDLADFLILKAIEEFPDNPQPVLVLARSRIQQKRYEDAQRVLQAATAVRSTPEIDQYLGLIAHKLGRPQEAFSRFVMAAGQFPDDLESQVLAGDYAFLIGHVSAAESLYFRAVQKWPYMDELRIRLIRLYLAENRIESAESQLKRLQFNEASRIEGTLLKGVILAKQGSYESAKMAFSQVLQREPESAEAHYFYGLCFLAQKEYVLAASEIHTALQLRKDSLRIRLSLAYVYSKQHKWLAALEEVNAVVAVNPNMAEARKLRAAISLQQQRYEKAIQDYKWLLERFPDSVQVRYWLAESLAASGKSDEALVLFRQVLHTYPSPIKPLEQMVAILISQARYAEAFTLCEEMASAIQDSAGLALLKAVVLIRQKAYVRAQSIVEEVMGQNPGLDRPLLVRAMIDEEQGRPKEAIEWYKKAIRLNPNNVLAYSKLARAFRQMGQPQQAIETYESLIAVQPDYAPALNNLAYLYWKTGRPIDRALQLAERALRGMPDQPQILDTLGCIYMDLGAVTTAEGYLNRALNTSPENPLFRLHLSMLRKRQGRLREAKQEIQKAMKAGLPESERHWAKSQIEEMALQERVEQETVQTIQSLLKKGQVDEAAELTRKGLDRNPASIEMLHLMGQIYFQKGSYTMSSSSYRQAIRMAPERADLHYRLALSLQRQGELDEAKTELGIAIRLGLEGRDRKAAERMLQEMATGKDRS